MTCYNCGSQMIWGGDFDFEDYGVEGLGIVSNHSCSGCGAYAEFYSPIEEEDDIDG